MSYFTYIKFNLNNRNGVLNTMLLLYYKLIDDIANRILKYRDRYCLIKPDIIALYRPPSNTRKYN